MSSRGQRTQVCVNCKRPSPNGYLCGQCCQQLTWMLRDLPTLIADLEITRTRQDQITPSFEFKGKGRDRSSVSGFNEAACNLAREIESTLNSWVSRLASVGLRYYPPRSVGNAFVGPLLPGWRRLPRGYSGSSEDKAQWLSRHTNVIIGRIDVAEIYRVLAGWVGDPDKPHVPGAITVATDLELDRIPVGICTSVKGWAPDGKPIECGQYLMASQVQTVVQCPKCGEVFDVAKHREKCRPILDLKSDTKIIESLRIAGLDKNMELVADGKPLISVLRLWVRRGRVQRQGFMHQGQYTEKRVRRGDTELYSFDQVRVVLSAEMACYDRKLKEKAS